MEMVTRKIGALAAKINTFLPGTFIDIAWLGHITEAYRSIFISTAITGGFFQWKTHILGDRLPQPFILVC